MPECRVELITYGIIELMHHCDIKILYFKFIFLDLRVICKYILEFIGQAVLCDCDTLGVLEWIQLALGVFQTLCGLLQPAVEIQSQVHQLLTDQGREGFHDRAAVVVDFISG